MSEEEVVFVSNDTTITKTMAKFGNSTYPIANIGAVTIVRKSPGWWPLGVLTAIGSILAFGVDAGAGLVLGAIAAVLLFFAFTGH
ncbi:MAG: hypothetical protein FJX45_00840 [Alphaproteobacteria bacterium]|nr:hypothetical protein [Alphaproteobacteria bacterium]